MLTFMHILFISMGICALSSFFVFFAKRFQIFMIGTFCFLSGVCLSLIETDMFTGLREGRFAGVALLMIFIFEFLSYRFIQKKNWLFYGLPFMAFISLAVSLDLINVLLGLTLFGLSFSLLARFKNKSNAVECFAKINAGLLCFSYAMAVIFSRLGILKLSDIRLQLSIKSNDEWLMFGFGLLLLGVLIELYGVLLSLRKEKQ